MAITAEAYRNWLLASEVVALAGYGKGLPIMRGWGLSLMRRLVSTAVEAITSGHEYEVHDPALLIEARKYHDEVSAFGGFEFIYEVCFRGEKFVIRPDGAVENLTRATQNLRNGGISTVVSCFQGYRDIRGATIPLFRDRMIWPFLQINQIVPAEESVTRAHEICVKLTNFFDRLCVPVRVVDMGPWKNYARRLYNVVGHLSDGSPTILAMFFVVGDAYRSKAGIPKEFEGFDIGLTEKVASFALMRHLDDKGFRLPRALAPFELAVEEELLHLPSFKWVKEAVVDLRTTLIPASNASLWRQSLRRGIPLQIRRNRKNVRIFSRIAGWSDFSKFDSLGERLTLHDQALLAKTIAVDLKRANPSYLGGGKSGEGDPVIAISPSLLQHCEGLSMRFLGPHKGFY